MEETGGRRSWGGGGKLHALAAALAGAGVVLAAQGARADDRAEPDVSDEKVCAKRYTVFAPLPDRCLEPIDTDRPHKTDTPGTVPAGHAQVELGIAEYEIERIRGASDNTVTIGNNIYKLGLAEHLGPIHHWDVQVLHALGSYGVRARRFQASPDLMVRTKLNLIDGPLHVTAVPAVILPAMKGGQTEGGGFVFFGAELPLDLDWELNLGAMSERDPDTARRHAAMVATTAFTRKIAGPLSGFGELYSDTTTTDARRWNMTADTGFLVRLGRDWQLDGGAYVGVQGAVPGVTPFLGLSSRL